MILTVVGPPLPYSLRLKPGETSREGATKCGHEQAAVRDCRVLEQATDINWAIMVRLPDGTMVYRIRRRARIRLACRHCHRGAIVGFWGSRSIWGQGVLEWPCLFQHGRADAVHDHHKEA